MLGLANLWANVMPLFVEMWVYTFVKLPVFYGLVKDEISIIANVGLNKSRPCIRVRFRSDGLQLWGLFQPRLLDTW